MFSNCNGCPTLPKKLCRKCKTHTPHYDTKCTVCSSCKRCGYCSIHEGCRCIMCKQCGGHQVQKDICSKCSSCKSHHVESLNIKNIKYDDFPLRKCEYTKAKEPSFILNPLPRTLGVEIELSNYGGLDQNPIISPHIGLKGYKSSSSPVYYYFERDGSVNNSERELVTGRMLGDNYIYAMTALTKAIKDHDTSADESCGLHVHVDAVDFNPEALRKILVAYTCIQEQLYGTLVDTSRQTNLYCPPLTYNTSGLTHIMNLSTSTEIMNFFYQTLYNLSIPNIDKANYTPSEFRLLIKDAENMIKRNKATKYVNHARRSALNFHSWMMRGTIEFRLKEGTVDPKDLLLWPLWCGWFIHKVSAISDKEIEWWIKKPPTLVELTETFTVGKSANAPKSLLEYVRKAVQGKPKADPVKEEDRQTQEQPPPQNQNQYLTPAALRQAQIIQDWHIPNWQLYVPPAIPPQAQVNQDATLYRNEMERILRRMREGG